MVSAHSELDELIKAHRNRLDRGGRPVSASDWEDICSLHEAASREHAPVEAPFLFGPVPRLDLLRVEFGIDDEPESIKTDAPGALQVGRPPEPLETDVEVRLRVELTKRMDNGGKPSLHSIERRLKELGYRVSYRHVWETAQSMKPGEHRD